MKGENSRLLPSFILRPNKELTDLDKTKESATENKLISFEQGMSHVPAAAILQPTKQSVLISL